MAQDEELLADYNGTFLECRDLMHSWRTLGYYRSGGWGSTHRTLICTRCGMERDDDWDGVLVRHRYQQPDNYKIDGVRVTKADIRHEQLRRATVYDTKDEMKKNAPRVRKPRLD